MEAECGAGGREVGMERGARVTEIGSSAERLFCCSRSGHNSSGYGIRNDVSTIIKNSYEMDKAQSRGMEQLENGL